MNAGKLRQPELSVKRSLSEEGSLCRNSPQLPGSQVIAALPPWVCNLLEDPGVSGPLLPNAQDGGEEKEGGGVGGEVGDEAGSSGRTGGACTHVHTCEHTWIVHVSANACGICHLGHRSGLQGVGGGSGRLGPQRVLKTTLIFIPCTPPTPVKTQVASCDCCREGGT